MLGGRRAIAPLARRGGRAADRDGGGDGRRRAWRCSATTTSASRTRSPATCRASSSTPAKRSRTAPRRRKRSPTCAAAATAVEVRGERRARRPRDGSLACRSSARRRNSSATSAGSTRPGDRPLTLRGLRGRVVLVDFWTYSCINCIRTLPYLKAWDERYRKDGLTIVGVHTPEFPFERDPGNVEEAIERRRPPLSRRPGQRTAAPGSAYANQYWPAEYFIDARGRVRYVHFGEGEYGEKEQVIRELLAEAGDRVGSAMAGAQGDRSRSRGDDAGDLPRRRPGRTLHQPDALARPARLPAPRRECRAERIRLPRPLADRIPLGDRGRRLARTELRRPPRLPRARLADGQPRRVRVLSTASRSAPRRRLPTSTAAS